MPLLLHMLLSRTWFWLKLYQNPLSYMTSILHIYPPWIEIMTTMTRFEVNVYNEIHKYYASLWNINTSYHSFLQFECRLLTPHTADRSDQWRHAECDGDPHRRVHLGCVQRAEETQHYIHVGSWVMSSSHQVMSPVQHDRWPGVRRCGLHKPGVTFCHHKYWQGCQ